MTDVKEQQLARLEWFVVRARRVEDHSLAQDKIQLMRWAEGTAAVGRSAQGKLSVRWNLPPEEPLESLAGRCRPFILKGDSVYWSYVTNALRYFISQHESVEDVEPLADSVQLLRKHWQTFDKDTPGSLGYVSRVGRNGEDLGEPVDAKELAYAWLYGDLVHADDVQERVGDHSINDRYRAGAILIANIACCTIMTLNIVRDMEQRGLIELSGDLFTQPVLAKPDDVLPISEFAVGPVGASMADLEATLDAVRTSAAHGSD